MQIDRPRARRKRPPAPTYTTARRTTKRDPRKWRNTRRNPSMGLRRKEKPPDRGKLIIPLIALIFIAGCWFGFGKKAVDDFTQDRKFKQCKDRLNEVQMALVKTRIDNPSITPSAIYQYMDKQTNINVEQYVGEKCTSLDGKPWNFDSHVQLPGTIDYMIIGRAKTTPGCDITITPDLIWPHSRESCGRPAPLKDGPPMLDPEKHQK